jgi:hypothetical protein
MNIFFALNPFKSNFELGLQEMHTRKIGEKIHGGLLRVWDPRTKTKPWFPPRLADIDGTVSLT